MRRADVRLRGRAGSQFVCSVRNTSLKSQKLVLSPAGKFPGSVSSRFRPLLSTAPRGANGITAVRSTSQWLARGGFSPPSLNQRTHLLCHADSPEVNGAFRKPLPMAGSF